MDRVSKYSRVSLSGRGAGLLLRMLRVLVDARFGAALRAALYAGGALAVAHAEAGYTTIFDARASGSNASFDKGPQVGGGNIALQADGTMQTSLARVRDALDTALKPFGDVSLKVEYRDVADDGVAGSNGGVLVRFSGTRGPRRRRPPRPRGPMTGAGRQRARSRRRSI